MTLAIIPRRDGDAFQARQFFYYASDMLRAAPMVRRVGFEAGPRGFDDFWVDYVPGKGPGDAHGDAVGREHFQCKWHASHGDYGYLDLIEPSFINAESVSLLQRALAGYTTFAPTGTNARFSLMSNWRPKATDALEKLVNTRTMGLKLDVLAKGKTNRSEMTRLRKAWCEHLGIDEDTLSRLARSLAFRVVVSSPEEQRHILNLAFEAAGLATVPLASHTLPHDDLVFQWAAQGRQEYDATQFRELCDAQNLLASPKPRAVAYGIKSFEHPIDPIEERCDAVLNLLPSFNQRFLKDDTDWAELYPKLWTFLLDAARASSHLRLIVDTHATLAFAAGSVLNTKSGRTVELEQRSGGRETWQTTSLYDGKPRPPLSVERTKLGDGRDIVVALGVTHAIAAKVREYADANLPHASVMLSCTVDGRSGQATVEDGAHAAELADQLAAAIKDTRTAGALQRVHLFIAAPNGLAFMAGQRAASMGTVTLYEFDFAGERSGSYEPSLTLPLPSAETPAG